ncbi:hypothetical protein [Methylotuvimicrobium buryatense]|uniref:hypothetical protein n=1 Tax=Methylotuvimicrobium buryatense TaxID=95641 RepID=UPI001586A3BF|nr:hypothetical protein [Methylotuvimicrobium buryatense]
MNNKARIAKISNVVIDLFIPFALQISAAPEEAPEFSAPDFKALPVDARLQ